MFKDKYRTATVQRRGGKYTVTTLTVIRDELSIVALTNTKEDVKSFGSAKEVNEYINSLKNVDYTISDIGGLRDDYVYISRMMRKSEKTRAYALYADSYDAMASGMFSKPSNPRVGQTFQQDKNTGDIVFLLESLNSNTFAVLFSLLQVERNKSRQIIRELRG